MHPNPIYRSTDTISALSFASDMGFGMLGVNGPEHPLLAHIPFVIDGNSALLHLVRSNPITRAVKDPVSATLAISGPHSYVSPDWYEMDDQVPTWNYVAVHMIGTLVPEPDDRLLGILNDLSDEFETRLLPKPVWASDKMDDQALSKMLRMIQPFRFEIQDVRSTYKLNQNKPDAVRLAAARQIANNGIGSEVETLSALMTSLKPKETK